MIESTAVERSIKMEDTGPRDFQNSDKVISMFQALAFISVFPRHYASAETML